MPKAPDPITSFGAELNATLRKGANQEVRIKFPNQNLAIRFIQRINKLRHAMRQAKHPDWEQMYRCSVTHAFGDKTTVVLAPKDSEFRSFLAAAGVDSAAPPPTTEVVVGESEPGNVDSFLADLSAATSIPKVLSEDTDAGPPEPSTDKL